MVKKVSEKNSKKKFTFYLWIERVTESAVKALVWLENGKCFFSPPSFFFIILWSDGFTYFWIRSIFNVRLRRSHVPWIFYDIFYLTHSHNINVKSQPGELIFQLVRSSPWRVKSGKSSNTTVPLHPPSPTLPSTAKNPRYP